MGKVGDVIVKLLLKSEQYDEGLKKAKKGTESFASQISKGFTAAVGKVAAVVAAIKGIAAVFGQVSQANQTFGDAFAKMVEGLKSRWNTFVTAVASADFSGVMSRMSEVADKAKKLYDATDAMGEIETATNIKAAKAMEKLAQLRIDARDQTKSAQERKAAAEKYLKIYKELKDMPLEKLGEVAAKTLDMYLVKMGTSLEGKTSSEIRFLELKFSKFFEWLATKEGLSALEMMQTAQGDPGGVITFPNGLSMVPDKNLAARDAVKSLVADGIDPDFANWANEYAKTMSDKNRKDIEQALVAYHSARGSYLAETQRIYSTLNTANAQIEKEQNTISGTLEKNLKNSEDAWKKSFNTLAKDLGEDLDIKVAQPDIYIVPDLELDESALQRELEKIQADVDREVEGTMSKMIDVGSMLSSALTDGIASGLEELFDQLINADNFDASSVLKALLDPLAEMCVTAGTLIMSLGLAAASIQTMIANPYTAIAAGAALIAVGAAAKAGLSALVSKNTSSGSTSTASASSATSSVEDIESELTINVVGRISGSDIVISGNRTLNKWSR